MRTAFFLSATLLAWCPSAWADEPVVVRAQPHDGTNAQSVAFSPDGKYVAAGFAGDTTGRFPLVPAGDGGVYVWEADSGKLFWSAAEYGNIVKLEFSRDGNALGYARTYGLGSAGTADAVIVLDAKTGAERHRAANQTVFAMSRAADEVFVGDALLSLKNFKKVRSFDGVAPAFVGPSAGGKAVVALYRVKVPTGNGDAFTRRMRGLAVFDAGRLERVRGVEDVQVEDSAFAVLSSDGAAVVTAAHGGTARVWAGAELENVKELTTEAGGHVLPVFSPDGKTLALFAQQTNGRKWKYGKDDAGEAPDMGTGRGGCEVTFFDTATWKESGRWRFADSAYPVYHTHTGRDSPEGNPPRFAYSPDGRYVLTGCNGAVLLDAATGKPVRQFCTEAKKDKEK